MGCDTPSRATMHQRGSQHTTTQHCGSRYSRVGHDKAVWVTPTWVTSHHRDPHPTGTAHETPSRRPPVPRLGSTALYQTPENPPLVISRGTVANGQHGALSPSPGAASHPCPVQHPRGRALREAAAGIYSLGRGGLGGCFSNYYLFSPCAAINNRPRPNILFPLALQTFLLGGRPAATGGTQLRALPLHHGGGPRAPRPSRGMGRGGCSSWAVPPCPLRGVEKEMIFFSYYKISFIVKRQRPPGLGGARLGHPKNREKS